MQSNEKTCKTCRCNEGVSCDVTNCVYHDCQNCCTAKEIAVGPAKAETSAETLCVTFRPKTEA